jgi:two-component system chemotaxis sensor kinase CheA
VVGDTLVVITDMTAELARARAEAAERDLLRLIERTSRDRAGFGEFIEETDRLIHRIEAAAERDADLDKDLKRDVHTLKGNSAIFGLTQIAEWCHLLEDGIAISPRLDLGIVHLLAHAWRDVKTKLEGVFGQLQRTGIEVDPEDIGELQAAIERGAPLGIVTKIIHNWTLERTRPRLDRFAEQIRGLATRLGKAEPTIDVADHRVRTDPVRFRSFWTVFSHVVRNAVDHGIEEPAQRTAAGKPEGGRIELVTRRDGNAVIIELADDGRGIDWEALRARATAAGLAHATRDDLVDAMFSDGITTRTTVTETSGRGVGLAALREVCTELGGTIQVDSERGRGTRFQFRFSLVGRGRPPSKFEVDDRPPSTSSPGLAMAPMEVT